MQAGKEGTTCLLGVAGSVKASVHVLVKGEKVESPAPESAIKGKRSCLLDGEARGEFWEMGKVKGEVSNVQYEHDPVEHTMEGIKRFLVDGIVRRRPTTPNVIMALLKTTLKRW